MIVDDFNKKIDVINGLRGIAIIAVIYQHSIIRNLGHFIVKHFGHAYIIGYGWIGVNLFFILSGFVLYKPYILGQRKFTTRADVLKFYKHRFLRLYPLYFFVCVISVIFYAGISAVSLKNLVETLSTISMFDSEQFCPSLNIVFWSLNLEIWFSILFPLLVYLIDKYGFNRVVLVVFIIAFIMRFIGSYYDWTNIHVNPIKDCVIGRMDDFVLGLVICRLYFANHKIFNLSSTLLTILSFVFIIMGCLLWDYISQHPSIRELKGITNNIYQFGFFFLIIVALKPNSIMNRIFKIKLLQLAGLMCFSLYAWHVLIISVFNVNIYFSISNLIYCFSFIFIVSAFSYRFIEFGSEKDWRKLFLIKSKDE